MEALVCGHLCLDIIPHLPPTAVFEPGKLIEAGPAMLSTGGAVSNTGVALSRLGAQVGLAAKVGPGIFGQAALKLLAEEAPEAVHHIHIEGELTTSYTVVISTTGVDRMFIHSPGANAEFGSRDVSDELLQTTRLMHLGYPPLLHKMMRDGGRELADLYRRAKEAGVTTSLDMSLPDLESESGKADWHEILAATLPYVDFFLPSIEELLFMLEPNMFATLRGAVWGSLPERLVIRLARKAMDLGARHVGVKVGNRGFVLFIGAHGGGKAEPNWDSWSGSAVWFPCYRVNVLGTTGAGDATIAGLLWGLLRGYSPLDACQAAVAVGAFCCEGADALSGIRPWPVVADRLAAGWERHNLELDATWILEGEGFVRKNVWA